MTIEEALAELAKRFVIYPDVGLTCYAPTGEAYVTICQGGQKQEGDSKPCVFFDKGAMVRDWLLHVVDYSDGRGNTLYWRCLPEVEKATVVYRVDGEDHCEDYIHVLEYVQGKNSNHRGGFQRKPRTAYGIYSRLLISDAAIVTRAA